MLWNEDQSPRVKSERKPTLREKWESVYNGSHRQCFKGDSCSFSHAGQRGKGRSSSPASHSKAKQTDGEGQKSSQGLGSKQENSKDKSEIPCRSKFCKNPSCKSWHPPVCQKYKSETGMFCGDKCHFRHVEAEVTSSKKSKKCGAKDQLRYEGVFSIGLCISRFLSEKSVLREEGKLGSKHAVKFSKGTRHQIKIRERKGSIVRYYPKACAS